MEGVAEVVAAAAVRAPRKTGRMDAGVAGIMEVAVVPVLPKVVATLGAWWEVMVF